LTFCRFLGSPSVKIVVGLQAKEFSLAKLVLTNASDFFAKALSGSFEEAQTGVLTMPETTVKAFELAVAFIFNFENRFLKFDINDFANEAEFITTMIDLSALSQVLILPALDKCANSNLRGLLDNNHSSLTINQIVHAFEVLYEKSEVRGAIVRTTLAHFCDKNWDVVSKDIFVDWKFGSALKISPGFMAAFFIANKDFNMGRIRL
jgi:hypothetical protein